MTLTLLEILPEKQTKKKTTTEGSNHLSLTEPQNPGWQGSSQWADEYSKPGATCTDQIHK